MNESCPKSLLTHSIISVANYIFLLTSTNEDVPLDLHVLWSKQRVRGDICQTPDTVTAFRYNIYVPGVIISFAYHPTRKKTLQIHTIFLYVFDII